LAEAGKATFTQGNEVWWGTLTLDMQMLDGHIFDVEKVSEEDIKMEPLTLATMIVNLVAPYLAQTGKVMAKKAGEVAWEKVKAVYATVKDKLASDAYAEQTLKRLEENPESESRQAALVGVLEEKTKDDLAFANALQKLLDEAHEAGAETITQQVAVSGQARTGDITQIGKIEGNIDLSRKR